MPTRAPVLGLLLALAMSHGAPAPAASGPQDPGKAPGPGRPAGRDWDPAEEHFERASLLIRQRDYDRAIPELGEAIRLNPKHDRAYYSRALCWAKKHEVDKMIADLGDAIRVAPSGRSSARYYASRGNVLVVAKGEYDKAVSDFNASIALDPTSPIGFYGRGMAWQGKGDHDKAIADFDEAIRMNPRFDDCYIRRAASWESKRDYARALADYDAVVRLSPRSPIGFNSRARVLATCPDAGVRDGKRAVESATRACELSGWNYAYSLELLAAACAEAGDFEAAVKWQERMMGLLANASAKEKARTRLDLYRARKPYHAVP
jgi:tetratricopeptide (TPR) repeat protein